MSKDCHLWTFHNFRWDLVVPRCWCLTILCQRSSSGRSNSYHSRTRSDIIMNRLVGSWSRCSKLLLREEVSGRITNSSNGDRYLLIAGLILFLWFIGVVGSWSRCFSCVVQTQILLSRNHRETLVISSFECS